MVGEYIRSLRTAAGLTQRELADRVGISASMLSLVEAERREPTVTLLRDIARALDIPSAALFAAALAEDPERCETSPQERQLRVISENLLAAVQHMLVVRRLRSVREQNRADAT